MSEKMDKLTARGANAVMNTYSRFPIALEKGEGAYIWDIDGKKYLDFVGGIAVNALGCGHKRLADTIAEQAKKLMHCSNLYYTQPQIELAELITQHSDFDKVFFCNSGAEANEAALKLCRKYADMKGKENPNIITMLKSFHGRTFGAVTATGQQKYQKGLGALLPGIKYVPFNDINAIKEAMDENTCGVLVEAIQGEGGIIPADKAYLEEIRALCDKYDALMVFDEVQTGIGRTGAFFAHQLYGIKPDVATMAKGLAGGAPIGAMAATDKAALAFKPGDHASTFGGNPLVTAAGTVVIDELFNNGVMENVKKQGAYLTEKLKKLQSKYPDKINDVRGIGLMQGIDIGKAPSEIIKSCIDKGLLLIGAGGSVIRFVPPLIITEKEIDEAIAILDKALEEDE